MTELELLDALTQRAGHDGQLAIAFSAGFDSVSLARLAVTAGLCPLLLHDDHATESSAQALACAQKIATELSLELRVLNAVYDSQGGGFEASARRARYRALEQAWTQTIWLAQSRDDYIETIWMRLLSGSSPHYWNAMPERRGQFDRPLLSVRRSVLRQWSKGAHADPMNHDDRFDRVWIRASGILELIDPNGSIADDISGLSRRVRALDIGSWTMPLDRLSPALRQLAVRVQLAELLPDARPRTRFVRELAKAAGRPSTKTRCFSVSNRSLYLRGGRLVLNSIV